MDAFLERALAHGESEAAAPRIVDIPARDGFILSASVFGPSARTSSRGTVIINSATAVLRSYYEPFAGFLAEHGFRVVTYDYRGIGGSRPARLRGFRARMRDWGELDFAGVLAWNDAQTRGEAPIVVGHSVGGQIVGLADNNRDIAALLLVGAQSGHFAHFAPPQRLQVLALWFGIIPSLTATLGYLPGFALGGEDLPAGVAREWARWGRRPGYIVGGADARRTEGFARFSGPLLSLSFTDDTYAPRAAVDALLNLYTGATRTSLHLSPADAGVRSLGHFGFFRRAHRDTLWQRALDWIQEGVRSESPATSLVERAIEDPASASPARSRGLHGALFGGGDGADRRPN
jgi:predicted alpha/beta hydrolase